MVFVFLCGFVFRFEFFFCGWVWIVVFGELLLWEVLDEGDRGGNVFLFDGEDMVYNGK